MLKPLQDRERGLSGSPLSFTKAAYVAALPTLRMEGDLRHHRGCVNHISFSESGDTLLSGSDDTLMGVWDVERRKLRCSLRTGHTANIFCTKHMPATGDRVAVTCAGDSEVRVHDLNARASMEVYTHHHDRVKKVITEAENPWLIISASEDGTVRQLDRRQPRGAPAVMTYVRSRGGNRMMELNSICSPAQRPHLFAVGGGDPYVRLYDRRATSARGHAQVVTMYSPAVGDPLYRHDNVTGVSCSADGRWVLGNYLNDYVYLFSLDGNRLQPAAAEPAGGSGGQSTRRTRRNCSAQDTEARDEAVKEVVETASEEAQDAVEDLVEAQLAAAAVPGLNGHERAEVLAARAGRYRREGRVAEAMVCAAAALRLSPQLGRAHYELAACHEANGNLEASLRNVELAKRLCWSQELEDLEARLWARFAEQQLEQAQVAADRGAVVAAHRAALARQEEDELPGADSQPAATSGSPPAQVLARRSSRLQRAAADDASADAAAAAAQPAGDLQPSSSGAAAGEPDGDMMRSRRNLLRSAMLPADFDDGPPDEDLAARFGLLRRLYRGMGQDPGTVAQSPSRTRSEGSSSSSSSSDGEDGEADIGSMSDDSDEAFRQMHEEMRQAISAHGSEGSQPEGEGSGMSDSAESASDEDDDEDDDEDEDEEEEEEEDSDLDPFMAWQIVGFQGARQAQADAGDGLPAGPPDLDESQQLWGTDCESDEEPKMLNRLSGKYRSTGAELINGEAPREPSVSPDGLEHGYVMRYRGHNSQQTIKDIAFVGPDDCAVAAGSDDGRMFIWDRATGRLLTAVQGDRDIVNCVAAHPHQPLLAACGLDPSVKLFGPHYGVHRTALQRRNLSVIAGCNERDRCMATRSWATETDFFLRRNI
ncbi:probable DDB1- and CUL4-associated factor 6 [Coccomyxa sp. Obi]|nr:probable DDB1- and CUL4-associated factor 6 [Coccomyxa sp. Obi]